MGFLIEVLDAHVVFALIRTQHLLSLLGAVNRMILSKLPALSLVALLLAPPKDGMPNTAPFVFTFPDEAGSREMKRRKRDDVVC